MLINESKTKHTHPHTHTWDGGAKSDKHHGCDGVPQPHSAAKMRRQVSDDGCEEANDDDGDDEAGPAIPVLSRRDKSEHQLPKHRHHVHEVVAAGRPAWLAPFAFTALS